MHIVELSPAFCWDCQECGRENFQRAVSIQLDPDEPDDAEQIRDMEGLAESDPIPEGMVFRMMTRPNRVTCRHCNLEFKAVDFGSREVGEDEEGD